MLTATYILSDGSRKTVTLNPGMSLMQGAIQHGITDILGECGGAAACATCHCFVETALAPLSQMSDHEDAMLDMTATDRTQQSRLSCQIVMTQALNGIVVRLPEQM